MRADSKLRIRNLTPDDVPKIIELQKKSFPYMASEGMIWKEQSLRSHIRIFPEGQFVADY